MTYPPNVQAPRRTGAFSLIPLSLFAVVTLLSFWIATQWTAAQLGYQPRLGASWLVIGTPKLYAPWAIFNWMYWYSTYAPEICTVRQARLPLTPAAQHLSDLIHRAAANHARTLAPSATLP